MYAKVVIADNDTNLSCIKLDINVSKCCALYMLCFDIKFNTRHFYANNFHKRIDLDDNR